jgi:hypothetical protein
VSGGSRNLEMIERIDAGADRVRFVIVGDSGAWPDPTAEAVFAQLVRQTAQLDPAPAFVAQLGDFAGPGTRERHERYLELVEPLGLPNICIVGNHDLDAADGLDNFTSIHGPVNFDFAVGHTRFFAIHSEPGAVGRVVVEKPPEGTEGPRDEDLAYLDEALTRAGEPNRIVLMHMPPYLDGHLAPHEDWGFEQREREFLEILRRHRVALVCCAHGLAFDRHVADGVMFVMSGGGGTGLCSHFRGVCTAGPNHPEDRGALFHAVEIAISEAGAISGRIVQAFDHARTKPRSFGPDAS